MAWRWQFHIDLRFWKVGMSIGWFGERHRDPSPPWQPEGPSNGQLLMRRRAHRVQLVGFVPTGTC